MVRAKCLLADRQPTPEQGLGPLIMTLGGFLSGEVGEDPRQAGGAWPQGLLEDRDGPLVERPGLLVSPLIPQGTRQVAHAPRDIGVLRPQDLLPDRQSPLESWLRLGEPAQSEVEDGHPIEAGGKIEWTGLLMKIEDGQGFAEESFGLLVLALPFEETCEIADVASDLDVLVSERLFSDRQGPPAQPLGLGIPAFIATPFPHLYRNSLEIKDLRQTDFSLSDAQIDTDISRAAMTYGREFARDVRNVPPFRTSGGICCLERTCGKPIFRISTRKLASISQLPQGFASRNSREMCGMRECRLQWTQDRSLTLRATSG